MVCAPIHVSLLQQRSTCIVPWLGDTRTEMRDSRPTGAPLYSAARPGVADEEPWGRANRALPLGHGTPCPCMPVHHATVPRISFECESCAFSFVAAQFPVDILFTWEVT